MIFRYLYFLLCRLCFVVNLFAQYAALYSKFLCYEKPACVWDEVLPVDTGYSTAVETICSKIYEINVFHNKVYVSHY